MLPTLGDVYHTPPLTEHYDTNEGSVGSGYIHEGRFGQSSSRSGYGS
jgi:hypothetical protein